MADRPNVVVVLADQLRAQSVPPMEQQVPMPGIEGLAAEGTAILLHTQRQFGYLVPPTPYGPFVFVPATADLKKVVGVEEWWHTDGIAVWREGGPRLTGAQAAEALRASFEQAAEKLPFRALGT